ncbi:hypothetical protein [Nitrosopumilus ureiphilus]|jgi:hypothetical protein|uniref:Uncharacterized protein n=1 Tax=Nitrosopumilus ureiphilus TaxID=1470067 RepID=A0A7D5M4X6_9ARCH|nr:hypothetical protein [Nitrosopumilus ureiphilus]QLH07374.1 hypothetical protein C5F50_10055 [Nitrosopumilus ureiphilus]
MKKSDSENKRFGLLLVTVLVVSLFSTTAYGDAPKNPNVNSIKVQYLAKTSESIYYIQFKTCIGQEHVQTPTFTITSDLGSKVVKYDKLQLANSCKNYETSVDAKHGSSILIHMPIEVMTK